MMMIDDGEFNISPFFRLVNSGNHLIHIPVFLLLDLCQHFIYLPACLRRHRFSSTYIEIHIQKPFAIQLIPVSVMVVPAAAAAAARCTIVRTASSPKK